MKSAELLAAHVEILDEGVGRPATNPILEFIPQATLDGWERQREARHREWVASIKDATCMKAAEAARSYQGATLIWVDVNGEFRAQRVSPEHSIIREFVPAHLRRGTR